MATVDIKTQPLNLTIAGDGTLAVFSVPTVNNAGANITLTGATATGSIVPAQSSFSDTVFSQDANITVLTIAAGVMTFSTAKTLEQGQYKMSLLVDPSGGSPQLLAQGTLTVK